MTMKARELALMIMYPVLLLVSTVFSQTVNLVAPALRLGLFTSLTLYAIIYTITALSFNGRRWRFFGSGAIFALLSLPTPILGAPFFAPKIGTFLITCWLGDVIFNWGYRRFSLSRWCMAWSALFSAILFISNAVNYLLFMPEVGLFYMKMAMFLLPVVVAEGAIGAYIGYNVFERRLKNLVQAYSGYGNV